MDDEVRSQLVELQRSLDSIGGEVKDIREEQTRSADSHRLLHQEHTKLVDRIDTHERRLEIHINDYERQAEHNELVHAHMTGATMALQAEVREFRGEFREDRAASAKAQAQDRKEAFLSAKQTNDALRKTIMTIVVSGGGLFLTLVGLLITLWTYADNLSRALGSLKAGAGL